MKTLIIVLWIIGALAYAVIWWLIGSPTPADDWDAHGMIPWDNDCAETKSAAGWTPPGGVDD